MAAGEPVEGDEGAGLALRPAPDRLVRAVARARIADKLFAKKQEVKLGRYHLLEMIGAGGMGVVWGAFDPELDRRVAIKLVKTELSSARDRILAEGKALAKLSHPNVVNVYDVGVVDDQIYIVMEWVRGENLRAHCREPRTVRELVALYRAAGEGLAAAHRAGLVHRDFKPDNAMVGDDGRVRVLDFGLARGEVRRGGGSRPDGAGGGPGAGGDRAPGAGDDLANATTAAAEDSGLTRGAGTPRYMPPEQAEGQELTPAADQYAFCVSLREALEGREGPDRKADVPRWLDEILARGTAREAAHRFASMDALLHALSRDPATVWRRRLVAAGAVAAAGAAFAVGTLRAGSAPELERCGGGAAEIARAWNDGVRDRMTAHLRALGPYGAQEAARLAGELSDYGARWAAAHRGACLAKERGELTAQLYERNLGCLSRAHAALETVVELLATVPAERLPSTVIASRELPDAARCADAQAGTVDPPPAAIAARADALGNDVARARVLAVALDPRGVEAAASASRQAAEVGYLPLVAGAQLVHGLALNTKQATVPAFAALDDAVVKALEAGDARVAIEAYARALYAIGITEREQLPAGAADRFGALPLVEAIAKQVGPPGGFARALLYNNLGIARLAQGDRDAARRHFEEARAVREATGARAVELASIWGNLAIVTADPARRDELFAREAAELERELGPDHPMTLDSRIAAAMFVENPRRAYELARAPCRKYRLHPHLPAQISHCSFEVGWLAEELGEPAEARDAMQAVQAVERGDSFEQVFSGAFLKLLDGRNAEAAAAMAALAERMRAHEQPWARFRAVNAWIAGATAELRAGRPDRARASLESALALIESSPSFSAGTYRQRRLARVRAMLARQLAGADPARGRALAEAAAAWYRAAGGAEPLVAELEALVRAGSR